MIDKEYTKEELEKEFNKIFNDTIVTTKDQIALQKALRSSSIKDIIKS